MRLYIYLTLLLCIIQCPLYGLNGINNFKVWETENSIRVTLDFETKPEYKKIISGSNKYHILNFGNSIFKNNSETYRIKDHGIEYFKIAQFDNKNVRLVANVNTEIDFKTFVMRKNSKYPYRVIIDYYTEKNNVVEDIHLPTVVIDAGHGGKDSGAIGKRGTYEKDIVLDIALKLEQELWETGKVNPVMTREKDVFVTLGNRVKVTENKNAVLFISIHNNAEPTGRARGFRAYILSEGGKEDKTEQLIASKENSSFEMFDTLKAKVKDKNVLGILYDLKLNQTLTESSLFANKAMNNFRKSFNLVDSRVRRAPFHVLKLAGIPGVLLECGFITNKTDERLLNNRFYRGKIANTIKDAVINYLDSKKMLVSEVKNLKVPDTYEIKPGDTLIKIGNRFKIDVENIKKINNIKDSSRIFAGRKIKLKI